MANLTSANSSDPYGRIEKIVTPYATELGMLLMDWNSLQTRMMFLFFRVLEQWGYDRQFRTWQAVWNAIPNDRMQRKTLLDAARVKFTPPAEDDADYEPWDTATTRENAIILEAIEWLVEKANNAGQRRDNAAHVPIIIDATKSLSGNFKRGCIAFAA